MSAEADVILAQFLDMVTERQKRYAVIFGDLVYDYMRSHSGEPPVHDFMRAALRLSALPPARKDKDDQD